MTKTEVLTKKEPALDYPIHDLLKKRWSPVAFSDQPVEPEKLRSILEAARWAPSSYNEQPWSFIIATKNNKEEFAKLLSCLVPGNQEWAKSAPVLMISVAQLQFKRNGKENRHALHDVGLAAENMVLQATSMGLFVHQMAGIDIDRIREIYGIPDNFVPVAGIAVGYIGDADAQPENLKERDFEERDRKHCRDFVYTGAWGKKAPLF
jgi:nitroreductase